MNIFVRILDAAALVAVGAIVRNFDADDNHSIGSRRFA
jgi:hypothetical protein